MNGVLTMPINANPAGSTPLQRILGINAAEQDYDRLDFREQLIIDLMIYGYSQEEIGNVLGLSQGWVSIIFKRIRFKMADSHLRQTLEIRQHMRETHTIVKHTHQHQSRRHNEDNLEEEDY